MFIIKYKKIFLSLSLFIVLLSLGFVMFLGLPRGIDFKGGALMQVTYAGVRPQFTDVNLAIKTLNLGESVVQESGDKDIIVKTRDLSESERVALLNILSIDKNSPATEKTFTSIGPSVGTELARKAIIAIILVILAIILFIAWAFRKVSEPVSSWKYGLIAIVTLAHDIIIPSGVFALLAYFRGAEVDTLFVVALLTVLGLSVSDTIVVFDRIRENLRIHSSKNFSDTVGLSLNQTITRSINTSLTVILVLIVLFFIGPDATKNFAIVLIVGMFFGTYSSIFVASPILVLVEGLQRKKLKK